MLWTWSTVKETYLLIWGVCWMFSRLIWNFDNPLTRLNILKILHYIPLIAYSLQILFRPRKGTIHWPDELPNSSCKREGNRTHSGLDNNLNAYEWAVFDDHHNCKISLLSENSLTSDSSDIESFLAEVTGLSDCFVNWLDCSSSGTASVAGRDKSLQTFCTNSSRTSWASWARSFSFSNSSLHLWASDGESRIFTQPSSL